MSTTEKGTQSNPYTWEEYETLANAGNWKGGYVKDESGEVAYMMAEVTVTGSGSGSGSSSGSGSGSDFEFNSYTSFPNPDDDDDDDDEDDDDYQNNSEIPGDHENNDSGIDSGIAGGGGGGATSPIGRALAIVSHFESNNTSETVYPNISRNGFISQLKEEIKDSRIINQGQNGTCGIAVICKYLAEMMPEQYAEMAISIYKTGTYDKWGLYVSEASKSGTDAQAGVLGTNALDCIVQGAFRNTYNEFPITTYNPFTDGSGWASITWPTEITNFFTENLNKNVSTSFNCDYDDLKDINYNKKFVIAAVDGTFDNGYNFGNFIPNHYVQILATDQEKNIFFWQWGEKNPYKSSCSRCYQIICIDR